MPRLVLAFSFEGLAISPLSAYGSSWVATPSLDRLAASGAVFDRCIVPWDAPHRVLQEIWDAPAGREAEQTGWIEAAEQQGLRPTLITDCLEVSELPQADRFAGVSLVNTPRPNRPCDEIEETSFSRLIAAVFEELSQFDAKESACLWVHSDFLTRVWDAPHDLIPPEDLADEPEEVEENPDGVPLDLLEEDGLPKVIVPRPPKIFRTVDPPRFIFGQQHDPDITLAWMNNYAAQIRLIDVLIGVILERMTSHADATLVVVGTSGFSLGEHGAIGHRVGPMRSPSIQVPLIIRGPGIPAIRSLRVCSPAGLGPLLLDHNGEGQSELRRLLTPKAWKETPREFSPCIMTQSHDLRTAAAEDAETSDQDRFPEPEDHEQTPQAIAWTTPGWMSVREVNADGVAEDALYLKPDDRSDANNVATRLADVIDRIREPPTHNDTDSVTP